MAAEQDETCLSSTTFLERLVGRAYDATGSKDGWLQWMKSKTVKTFDDSSDKSSESKSRQESTLLCSAVQSVEGKPEHLIVNKDTLEWTKVKPVASTKQRWESRLFPSILGDATGVIDECFLESYLGSPDTKSATDMDLTMSPYMFHWVGKSLPWDNGVGLERWFTEMGIGNGKCVSWTGVGYRGHQVWTEVLSEVVAQSSSHGSPGRCGERDDHDSYEYKPLQMAIKYVYHSTDPVIEVMIRWTRLCQPPPSVSEETKEVVASRWELYCEPGILVPMLAIADEFTEGWKKMMRFLRPHCGKIIPSALQDRIASIFGQAPTYYREWTVMLCDTLATLDDDDGVAIPTMKSRRRQWHTRTRALAHGVCEECPNRQDTGRRLTSLEELHTHRRALAASCQEDTHMSTAALWALMEDEFGDTKCIRRRTDVLRDTVLIRRLSTLEDTRLVGEDGKPLLVLSRDQDITGIRKRVWSRVTTASDTDDDKRSEVGEHKLVLDAHVAFVRQYECATVDDDGGYKEELSSASSSSRNSGTQSGRHEEAKILNMAWARMPRLHREQCCKTWLEKYCVAIPLDFADVLVNAGERFTTETRNATIAMFVEFDEGDIHADASQWSCWQYSRHLRQCRSPLEFVSPTSFVAAFVIDPTPPSAATISRYYADPSRPSALSSASSSALSSSSSYINNTWTLEEAVAQPMSVTMELNVCNDVQEDETEMGSGMGGLIGTIIYSSESDCCYPRSRDRGSNLSTQPQRRPFTATLHPPLTFPNRVWPVVSLGDADTICQDLARQVKFSAVFSALLRPVEHGPALDLGGPWREKVGAWAFEDDFCRVKFAASSTSRIRIYCDRMHESKPQLIAVVKCRQFTILAERVQVTQRTATENPRDDGKKTKGQQMVLCESKRSRPRRQTQRQRRKQNPHCSSPSGCSSGDGCCKDRTIDDVDTKQRITADIGAQTQPSSSSATTTPMPGPFVTTGRSREVLVERLLDTLVETLTVVISQHTGMSYMDVKKNLDSSTESATAKMKIKIEQDQDRLDRDRTTSERFHSHNDRYMTGHKDSRRQRIEDQRVVIVDPQSLLATPGSSASPLIETLARFSVCVSQVKNLTSRDMISPPEEQRLPPPPAPLPIIVPVIGAEFSSSVTVIDTIQTRAPACHCSWSVFPQASIHQWGKSVWARIMNQRRIYRLRAHLHKIDASAWALQKSISNEGTDGGASDNRTDKHFLSSHAQIPPPVIATGSLQPLQPLQPFPLTRSASSWCNALCTASRRTVTRVRKHTHHQKQWYGYAICLLMSLVCSLPTLLQGLIVTMILVVASWITVYTYCKWTDYVAYRQCSLMMRHDCRFQKSLDSANTMMEWILWTLSCAAGSCVFHVVLYHTGTIPFVTTLLGDGHFALVCKLFWILIVIRRFERCEIRSHLHDYHDSLYRISISDLADKFRLSDPFFTEFHTNMSSLSDLPCLANSLRFSVCAMYGRILGALVAHAATEQRWKSEQANLQRVERDQKKTDVDSSDDDVVVRHHRKPPRETHRMVLRWTVKDHTTSTVVRVGKLKRLLYDAYMQYLAETKTNRISIVHDCVIAMLQLPMLRLHPRYAYKYLDSEQHANQIRSHTHVMKSWTCHLVKEGKRERKEKKKEQCAATKNEWLRTTRRQSWIDMQSRLAEMVISNDAPHSMIANVLETPLFMFHSAYGLETSGVRHGYQFQPIVFRSPNTFEWLRRITVALPCTQDEQCQALATVKPPIVIVGAKEATGEGTAGSGSSSVAAPSSSSSSSTERVAETRNVRMGTNGRPEGSAGVGSAGELDIASSSSAHPAKEDRRTTRVVKVAGFGGHPVVVEMDVLLDKKTADAEVKGPKIVEDTKKKTVATVGILDVDTTAKWCVDTVHVRRIRPVRRNGDPKYVLLEVAFLDEYAEEFADEKKTGPLDEKKACTMCMTHRATIIQKCTIQCPMRLAVCKACSKKLHAERGQCTVCATKIRGTFELDPQFVWVPSEKYTKQGNSMERARSTMGIVAKGEVIDYVRDAVMSDLKFDPLNIGKVVKDSKCTFPGLHFRREVEALDAEVESFYFPDGIESIAGRLREANTAMFETEAGTLLTISPATDRNELGFLTRSPLKLLQEHKDRLSRSSASPPLSSSGLAPYPAPPSISSSSASSSSASSFSHRIVGISHSSPTFSTFTSPTLSSSSTTSVSLSSSPALSTQRSADMDVTGVDDIVVGPLIWHEDDTTKTSLAPVVSSLPRVPAALPAAPRPPSGPPASLGQSSAPSWALPSAIRIEPLAPPPTTTATAARPAASGAVPLPSLPRLQPPPMASASASQPLLGASGGVGSSSSSGTSRTTRVAAAAAAAAAATDASSDKKKKVSFVQRLLGTGPARPKAD